MKPVEEDLQRSASLDKGNRVVRVGSLGRNKTRRALLLVMPAFLMILALVLYPLGFALYKGLHASGTFSFENYRHVLIDSTFWRVALVTTEFTVIMIGGELLLGMAVAMGLQRLRSQLRNLLRSIIVLPLLVAPIVASYEWMWLLNDQYGLLNYLLKLAGAHPPLWLSNPSWAFVSVVIVDMWIATPFVILMVQTALSTLPNEPFEAARIDGASAIQIFLHLTLPFLRSVILVILIIRTMDVFRLYDIVAIVTSGGPGLKTTTLSLFAFQVAMNYADLPRASAMAVLTVIPILAISFFYIRLLWSRR